MKKTTKKELQRRRNEFKKIYSKYQKFRIQITELRKKEIEEGVSTNEEISEIYESQEYRDLEELLTSGPIYDLSEDDLKNPGYLDVFGCHPLDNPKLANAYVDVSYGDRIETPYGPGTVRCLAYNYGDVFYKVLLEDTNEETYILIENESD